MTAEMSARRTVVAALSFVAKAVVWTLGLLAEECSLRAKGKARSLKVLLRTSVAAFAIFAEAF